MGNINKETKEDYKINKKDKSVQNQLQKTPDFKSHSCQDIRGSQEGQLEGTVVATSKLREARASTGAGQPRLCITMDFKADSDVGKCSELHNDNTAFFTLVN